MAQYDVEVEQLVRQTINATVEADDPDHALVRASDPANWTEWDADTGGEDIVENRPLNAQEVEE